MTNGQAKHLSEVLFQFKPIPPFSTKLKAEKFPLKSLLISFLLMVPTIPNNGSSFFFIRNKRNWKFKLISFLWMSNRSEYWELKINQFLSFLLRLSFYWCLFYHIDFLKLYIHKFSNLLCSNSCHKMHWQLIWVFELPASSSHLSSCCVYLY